MNLEQVFLANRAGFGVFRLAGSVDLTSLQTLASNMHLGMFVIDGEKVKDKQQFLKSFVETLKSPHIVTKDWDYFERLLELLDWVDSDGTVIVYKDFQHFWKEAKRDFDILLDIFKSVVKFRESRLHFPEITPLYIFIQGDDTIELEIEWVDG